MSLEIAKRIVQLISSDSIDGIKRLLGPYSLEQRRFIMSTDISGSSILYHAVLSRSSTVAKYFLDECGANPNSFGIEQLKRVTCLSKAVTLDHKDMIETLLKRGANINAVSDRDETALSTACFLNNIELIEFLIENGANVNHQNCNGYSHLRSFLYKYERFKKLVLNGVNINSVDVEGCTILMHALMTQQKKIIFFLLTRKDIDIRIKNHNDKDALSLAIHFCSDNITQRIIKSGGYTEEDVIREYELESYFCFFQGRHSKSNRLWRKSLRLRNLPMDTPIFNNLLPNQISDNDIKLFREDHRQALLYMRALYGPRHVFILQATMIALMYLNVHQNAVEMFETFSKNLHSLNIRDFLKMQLHIENFFKKYLSYFSAEPTSLENFFKMFSRYSLIFCEKQKQTMTPSLRKFYAVRFQKFLSYFIKIIPFLMNTYTGFTHIIYQKIKTFLQIDLKNSTSSSLVQMCWKMKKIRTLRILLICGADVNRTDENYETILHYLLDSKISCKRGLIKLVVDAGFDFSRVRSLKYCLPCRMKKERFFYYPKECNTLQCLAANAFCQKIVFQGSDIPPILRTIIKTHMHIP